MAHRLPRGLRSHSFRRILVSATPCSEVSSSTELPDYVSFFYVALRFRDSRWFLSSGASRKNLDAAAESESASGCAFYFRRINDSWRVDDDHADRSYPGCR